MIKVFALIGLVLTLLWVVETTSWTTKSVNCFADNKEGAEGVDKCLEWTIMNQPAIKEIQGLAKACEESDEECIRKVAEKALKSKLKNLPKENKGEK